MSTQKKTFDQGFPVSSFLFLNVFSVEIKLVSWYYYITYTVDIIVYCI